MIPDNANVSWNSLEQLEFKTLGDMWGWFREGELLAADSGLIIAQAKYELTDILRSMSGAPRGYQANVQARRVTRHLASSANHMAAIKRNFHKMPQAVMAAYAEEIGAARHKGKRPRIDLSKD